MTPGVLAVILGGAYDPAALDWRARVRANVGSVSPRSMRAQSDLAKALKASGVWPKISRLNTFCGDQLAACLVPLKVGGGNATETNVNFVSGDYTEATGLTGGSGKYLDTGLVPSTSLTTNSTHLAVYDRSSVVGGGMTVGVSDTTARRLVLHAPFTDGTIYSDEYNDTTGRVSVAMPSTPFGFIVGSRTALSAHAIYRNGSSLASNATSGGSLATISVYVFASNVSGVPNFASTHMAAGYSIGDGLAAGDVAAYYTAMQAFQTALRRQV